MMTPEAESYEPYDKNLFYKPAEWRGGLRHWNHRARMSNTFRAALSPLERRIDRANEDLKRRGVPLRQRAAAISANYSLSMYRVMSILEEIDLVVEGICSEIADDPKAFDEADLRLIQPKPTPSRVAYTYTQSLSPVYTTASAR